MNESIDEEDTQKQIFGTVGAFVNKNSYLMYSRSIFTKNLNE